MHFHNLSRQFLNYGGTYFGSGRPIAMLMSHKRPGPVVIIFAVFVFVSISTYIRYNLVVVEVIPYSGKHPLERPENAEDVVIQKQLLSKEETKRPKDDSSKTKEQHNVDVKCAANNTDCNRLKEVLKDWPDGKPKGVIYILTQNSRLLKLKKALNAIDAHFNNDYHYPVILFHEEDLVPHYHEIANGTKSKLYFQQVPFQLPKQLLDKNIPKVIKGCPRSDIGYRHMTHFLSHNVYKEPILQGFEYIWRLDDDAVLTRKIGFDIFGFMSHRYYDYGYIITGEENPNCVEGLWETAASFMKNNAIQPFSYDDLPKPMVYRTSFEVSRMQTWSQTYLNFMEYIDLVGGIYYHRWSDAALKTVAMQFLVPEHKRHQFKGIGFKHHGYAN